MCRRYYALTIHNRKISDAHDEWFGELDEIVQVQLCISKTFLTTTGRKREQNFDKWRAQVKGKYERAGAVEPQDDDEAEEADTVEDTVSF